MRVSFSASSTRPFFFISMYMRARARKSKYQSSFKMKKSSPFALNPNCILNPKYFFCRFFSLIHPPLLSSFRALDRHIKRAFIAHTHSHHHVRKRFLFKRRRSEYEFERQANNHRGATRGDATKKRCMVLPAGNDACLP